MEIYNNDMEEFLGRIKYASQIWPFFISFLRLFLCEGCRIRLWKDEGLNATVSKQGWVDIFWSDLAVMEVPFVQKVLVFTWMNQWRQIMNNKICRSERAKWKISIKFVMIVFDGFSCKILNWYFYSFPRAAFAVAASVAVVVSIANLVLLFIPWN